MLKPDEQTMFIFSRLAQDANGYRLLEWLKASREKQWKDNDRLRGEDAIIARGMTLNLTEIIDTIEGAGSYLERKAAERNRVIPE